VAAAAEEEEEEEVVEGGHHHARVLTSTLPLTLRRAQIDKNKTEKW
jgi:hypothetical protein